MNTPVNILLIDDEVRNLDVLESVLQMPEYNLVRALTAERALQLLLDGEFAAIVLDIQMPEMTGIELADLIKQRKRTQHIPIIFLTAYFHEAKDVLRGYTIGAVDYLTKPVDPQILRSKIAVFADLFRKTQALAATNAVLEQEILQRQKAEAALRTTNNELEGRVQERTADLQQARDRAVAASRAKDDFLAKLSHELRTPLNPVLLLASDGAGNPALPAGVRADFESIAKNVELEARLIDDLLDLTRITQGKLAFRMRPLDVLPVFREAITLVSSDLDQKRLRLTLKLDAQPSRVLGDDVRLKQIFWNVFKNAVKFTPPGGTITVEATTTPDGGQFIFQITDTGIGMTSEELARIFEAFSQGDHAIHGAHQFGGLGLGLAISRALAKHHGGSIRATSAGPNRGCTFWIELPLLPAGTADEGGGSASGGEFRRMRAL